MSAEAWLCESLSSRSSETLIRGIAEASAVASSSESVSTVTCFGSTSTICVGSTSKMRGATPDSHGTVAALPLPELARVTSSPGAFARSGLVGSESGFVSTHKGSERGFVSTHKAASEALLSLAPMIGGGAASMSA